MITSASFPDVRYVTIVIVLLLLQWWSSADTVACCTWYRHLVATPHCLGFEMQGGRGRKKVGKKHLATAILSCAESALGYCCPFIAALWWQVQQSLIRTACVLSWHATRNWDLQQMNTRIMIMILVDIKSYFVKREFTWLNVLSLHTKHFFTV